MWRLLMLSLISLWLIDAQAQVTVQLSNLPTGEVPSGSSHTIVVNVKNQSPDTLELVFDQTIPKPLRALVFTKKFTVNAGETKNILVPVSVPRRTPAGNYDLTFSILKGTELQDKKSTNFNVPKRIELDVELISRPPYARANDTIQARFLVSNSGNDREVISMFSRNCLFPGEKVISIPPDSSVFVDVFMIPDVTLMRIDEKAIDLSCNIQSADKVVSDQEIIRIYPIKTKKLDPYLRYPISVNTNYIYRISNGETTLNTYQVQISGKGPLDVKKRHNLIFEYRGPGSVRITRIGNFAQKYAQYYNKRFDVFVGERTFGLSNLTENFRFGSGVQVNALLGKGFKIGTYYNRPLLQPEIDGQTAGYLQYETPKKHLYRINTIVNDLHNSSFITLTSFQSTWSNFNTWSFSTELSHSQANTGGGFAYSYSGSAEFKRLKLSSTGLYADNNFKGYYKNSTYLNLSAGYNLEKIGFQLGGNFNDENPNLDTVYSASPYSIFLNGGLIGRFTKNWNLQLLGLYRQKIDRLSTKRFDYQERRIRFASAYRYGFWTARILTEGGITRNLLVADTLNQNAFGFDAQIQWRYAPSVRFSIGGFGQFLSNTRYEQQRFRYFLYGGDIRYRIHRKVSLEAEFQNNYLVEDLYNDRNLLNFALDWQALDNHKLRAVANYGILHQQPIRRDWYMSASYAFKVGVPLKKMLSLGSVQGQIQNNGVDRVDKVVLILDGQLVTTDELGRFKFNNVRPGHHQIFIDKRSIGVRDMPDIKMPIEIDVLPEQTAKVSFGLTRSGSISGKVEMVKVRVIQSSKEKIVLPRVIVEVSNGDEKHLTQTNAEGEFLFGSLRPGTWHIRIIPTYWKDKFIIKIGEVDVVLAADGSEEVKLLIQPKVREIKFLDTKTIKIGGE